MEQDGGVSDALALVALRALMEEGVRRSTDPSPIARRVSVVILDGAVEAAIGLCLDRFGQEGGEKLEDGYSKMVHQLKESGLLPTGGAISSWPEVRRLRRARNSAQHHGIVPDSGELQRWSGSVVKFVEHAVLLAFGLELSLVCWADALSTADFQEQLREAERLLGAGNVHQSVVELGQLFRAARRQLDSQHRAALPASPVVAPAFGMSHDATTAHIEDLLSVAMFATDLGEYVWCQNVWNAVRVARDSAEVSEVDARRVMAFVFNWVLRWEAFSATYIADRLGRSRPTEPPHSPHPDGRPVLIAGPITVEIRPPDNGRPDLPVRFAARVPFAAGSDQLRWSSWRHWLSQALHATSNGPDCPWSQAFAWDDGHFELIVPQDVNRQSVAAALNCVIEGAVRRAETAKEESERQQAILKSALPLRDALRTYRQRDGSCPFADVTVEFSMQDSEGNMSVMVKANFTPELNRLGIERLRRGANRWMDIPGPGKMHPIGIFIPGDTPIEQAIGYADECLAELNRFSEQVAEDLAVAEAARQALEDHLNTSETAPNFDRD